MIFSGLRKERRDRLLDAKRIRLDEADTEEDEETDISDQVRQVCVDLNCGLYYIFHCSDIRGDCALCEYGLQRLLNKGNVKPSGTLKTTSQFYICCMTNCAVFHSMSTDCGLRNPHKENL